ncbi:unnamed protein product, partial [Mesorhabditis spiculigera]
MRQLFLVASLLWLAAGTPPVQRVCQEGDDCSACTVERSVAGNCTDADQKAAFYYCNPRTKKINVESASFLECQNGTWKQAECPMSERHFSLATLNCTDPSKQKKI